MRRLSVLGSTGSIGTQTLEVARADRDFFEVKCLACGSNVSLLHEQIREFEPDIACVASEKDALLLQKEFRSEGLRTEVVWGDEGLIETASYEGCDTTVGAMVGVAGLVPTYHAIRSGKDIALANKETLVAGGDIVMPLVKEKGVALLPVDSEHCAIWQCLWGEQERSLDRILITASGGPFRGRSRDELKDVTVEQALGHPTWKMGGKITIDSSTMMNKGLEVIEASHLFNIDVDRIDVVVHPQSVIHSMIRTCDGSVLAQMGKPSMILPIMIALYYPSRGKRILEEFDPFAAGMNNLTFEKCDTDVFGLLDLAYDAGRVKGFMPAVMNAANETAVYAFLDRRIGFLDIEKCVRTVYDSFAGRDLQRTPGSVEEIMQIDREARAKAAEVLSI